MNSTYRIAGAPGSIKHARRIQYAHDRYSHFVPYGDASACRDRIDEMRNDFKDLKVDDTWSEVTSDAFYQFPFSRSVCRHVLHYAMTSFENTGYCH